MRIKRLRLGFLGPVLLLLCLIGATAALGHTYSLASKDAATPRDLTRHAADTVRRAPATLELYGTFHAMGVIVTVAAGDDPDGDATATVEYRTGGDPYRAGFPLSRVSDTRFVGSLFWLQPGTSYDVRVAFSDADGDPQDGVMVAASGATRSEITTLATVNSYYVATNHRQRTERLRNLRRFHPQNPQAVLHYMLGSAALTRWPGRCYPG